MNQFQEGLLEQALNHYRAEATDTGFTLTDSFRTLHFEAESGGYRQGETLIKSKGAFKEALVPPESLNAGGLTEGYLLTQAGQLRFNLRFIRERLTPETNIRVHLQTTQPTRFHSVIYREIQSAVYVHSGHRNSPTHVVQRQDGSHTHEVSKAMRSYLYELSAQAMTSLLTPAAHLACEVQETERRLQAKEEEIAKATQERAAIQQELAELKGQYPFAYSQAI